MGVEVLRGSPRGNGLVIMTDRPVNFPGETGKIFLSGIGD